jgi:tetratricopeptide (TPR) repeat protein
LNYEQLTPLIDKYQKVLEQNPRSLVFAPLAECYRKLGMLKEASILLRDGIKNHPQYVLGHIGMAELARDQGNYQLVYTLLKTFKDSHRDNFKLMKLYARSCFQLQHFEEALQTYKYILFLNPKDKDAAMMIDQLEDQPILKGDIDKKTTEKEYFNVNEIRSELTEESDWVEQNFDNQTKKLEDNSSQWQMQSIQDVPVDENREAESDSHFGIEPSQSDEQERKFHVVSMEDDENESVSHEDQPFITHTLVDLYVGQGYLEKASELLEKIIELNPNDENSSKKLESIRSSMIEAGILTKSPNPETSSEIEEEQSEDEGRSKLMRILDATLNDSNLPDDSAQEEESDLKERLESKLWVFHERLREKAQQNQD